jgi:hypothetical protein
MGHNLQQSSTPETSVLPGNNTISQQIEARIGLLG